VEEDMDPLPPPPRKLPTIHLREIAKIPLKLAKIAEIPHFFA
jgi:hypothetical protein